MPTGAEGGSALGLKLQCGQTGEISSSCEVSAKQLFSPAGRCWNSVRCWSGIRSIDEASPQQAAGYQAENLIVMRNHGFSNSSL